MLSCAGDQFVAQWNLANAAPDPFSVKMQSVVLSSVYIKERNQLLVGTLSGSLHIIDLDTKTEIKNLTLKAGGIFSITYSEIQQKIFLTTAGGKLVMLNALTYVLEKELPVSALKLRTSRLDQKEERLYVTDGSGELHIFETGQLKHIHSFAANKLSCNVVALHPSESLILTGGRDAYLNAYDAKSYHLVKSIPAHNFAIYDIKFMEGTACFATASRDKTVKLWDTHSLDFLLRINKEQFDGHTHSVNALYWNKSNHCLVSAGDDRRIILWNVA